ncbi:MAG: hypothetical protein JO270_27740 [Acidobacteriaceae bacterium]|nr:hypothetical protein [Acidobacteriaceae bacterium]
MALPTLRGIIRDGGLTLVGPDRRLPCDRTPASPADPSDQRIGGSSGLLDQA